MNPAESISLPSLHLLLVPKATQSGKIAILQFSVTVQNLPHKAGDFLCTYTQHQDDAHSSRLQHFLRGIQATLRDGDGALPFTLSDDDDAAAGRGTQRICVAREARGDIVFSSEVRALGGVGTGDVSALRRDQGGILGAGGYFLPWFKVEGRCHLSVAWDLANCPEGTRAVCSLGEGPGPVDVSGHAETLLDCVFMVGPINSHPPVLGHSSEEEEEEGEGEVDAAGFCSTYWFGDLPERLTSVKAYVPNMFPRMAEHFKDEGGSYREFLRRVPKGFRSQEYLSSSIVDYDVDIEDDHDWDVVRILNRAMVSAWARLDPEDDGSENRWFTDGLALLYTVYLPFRFGQRGPDYFRATVNAFLSAYYTNPFASKPQYDLLDHHHHHHHPSSDPRENWYVTSAKTTRAFVYMLKMDTYTRRAAVARNGGVLRPIDDVVRDLCTRRRAGERVQKKDWLEAMAAWIGQEDAERYFRDMIEDGKVHGLHDMASSFGSTYGPQPVAQEPLDFGFDRNSLGTGVVKSVVSPSRAHEAGLRNGDRIMWHSRPEACELHYGETFKLSLWRAGEQIETEYLPRARSTVRCWQVLERPKPSGEAG